MQTKAGGLKVIETMIRKHGSYDAWRKEMQRLGAIGGKLGRTGGFYQNRELARVAGAKGGTISRRGKRNALYTPKPNTKAAVDFGSLNEY